MEDYFIYAIVLLALFFILKKTFGKSGCGCGSEGKCSSTKKNSEDLFLLVINLYQSFLFSKIRSVN